MPFAQRIPKLPGFKNPFKKIYSVVNLSKLSRFEDGAKVDVQTLVEAGLVHPGKEVKILGTGGLKRKLTVEAHFFSTSAREAIEKSGGSVKVLGEPRKIGPRRTAAKAPKPLPAAQASSPPAGEVARSAGGEVSSRQAAGDERRPQREKKGAPPPAAVEEATPPDES